MCFCELFVSFYFFAPHAYHFLLPSPHLPVFFPYLVLYLFVPIHTYLYTLPTTTLPHLHTPHTHAFYTHTHTFCTHLLHIWDLVYLVALHMPLYMACTPVWPSSSHHALPCTHLHTPHCTPCTHTISPSRFSKPDAPTNYHQRAPIYNSSGGVLRPSRSRRGWIFFVLLPVFGHAALPRTYMAFLRTAATLPSPGIALLFPPFFPRRPCRAAFIPWDSTWTLSASLFVGGDLTPIRDSPYARPHTVCLPTTDPLPAPYPPLALPNLTFN